MFLNQIRRKLEARYRLSEKFFDLVYIFLLLSYTRFVVYNKFIIHHEMVEIFNKDLYVALLYMNFVRLAVELKKAR